MTKTLTWHIPSFGKVQEEVEKIAQLFEKAYLFILVFLRAERTATLTPLTDEIWIGLQNSDSFHIKKGDWDMVKRKAELIGGDWKAVKAQMERCSKIDAPIIWKSSDFYHLVSGDTRLMTARALGIRPMVTIVNV